MKGVYNIMAAKVVTKESSTHNPSLPRGSGPPRVKVSNHPPTNSHELQTSRTPITATLRALYGLLIGFVDRD